MVDPNELDLYEEDDEEEEEKKLDSGMKGQMTASTGAGSVCSGGKFRTIEDDLQDINDL